jgi:hypothetical protein
MSISSRSEFLDQDVLARADARLRDVATLPFSPAGFDLLKSCIVTYIRELVGESIEVSKRHKADTVSPAHVERAAEFLVSSAPRGISRHLGVAGGMLLGAGLSNIFAATVSGQYSGLGIAVSTVSGIAGAFLVALHIARD